MSLDEKLFGFVWKSAKNLSSRKRPDSTVQFKDIEGSLSIFSSCLFEEVLPLKETSGFVGRSGDYLFLPEGIWLFDKANDNHWSYMFLSLTSMIMWKGGFSVHTKYPAEDQRLLGLLIAPKVLELLLVEFPLFHPRSKFNMQKWFEAQRQKQKRKNPVQDSWNQVVNAFIQGPKALNDLIDSQKSRPFPFFSKIKDAEKWLKGLDGHKKKRLKVHLLSEDQYPCFFPHPSINSRAQFHYTDGKLKQEATELDEKVTTELKSKSKEFVRPMSLDQDRENYNPANLVLEAVKTADLFSGGRKRVDGSDELNEHKEALDELDINEILRSDQGSQSVFQADVSYEMVIEEVEESPDSIHCFKYAEWNYKKKSYLNDWCWVTERKGSLDTKNSEKHKLITEIRDRNIGHILKLRAELKRAVLEREWKNRQKDGEMVDLDSAIENCVNIKINQSPSDRVYLRKRKSSKDVSILILLDASLSSDSWVDGRRVIDTAKETIVVLGEALQESMDQISVMAFNGKTRKNCIYNVVKDSHEDWSACMDRLVDIEPDGYTRIGVALRHSTEKILKSKSKKKVIILLSDGKPSDYDVYEGKHGIHDVRQAIREANQNSVGVLALAIDRRAKYHFPQMFGAKNFKMINDPKHLPDTFVQFFIKSCL